MVQGVILGGVDVEVHLVAPVEAELAHAGLIAPRNAVVAFHRAAVGHIRPVHHGAHGDITQLQHAADIVVREGVLVGILRTGHIHQHLAEGLLGVEPAGIIVVQHGYMTLRGDLNGIAAGNIGNLVPQAALALGGAVLHRESGDGGLLFVQVCTLRGGIDGAHGICVADEGGQRKGCTQ